MLSSGPVKCSSDAARVPLTPRDRYPFLQYTPPSSPPSTPLCHRSASISAWKADLPRAHRPRRSSDCGQIVLEAPTRNRRGRSAPAAGGATAAMTRAVVGGGMADGRSRVPALRPSWPGGGSCRPRVVQPCHGAGVGAAWHQPSCAPRRSPPAVTVMARFFSGCAALHRPLGLPQPVQLRRQRPGAVLQVLQVAVAVERPAVDAARQAAPIAGLRGTRTSVVGPRPARASAGLVEPRSGRDADLPRPARLPAGHQVSLPLAWLPGSDQPTRQAGTAKPEPHGTCHRTPRR
jgi:hypothetical protein